MVYYHEKIYKISGLPGGVCDDSSAHTNTFCELSWAICLSISAFSGVDACIYNGFSYASDVDRQKREADMKITGIAILVIFYSILYWENDSTEKKGIQTDQMARGKQKDKTFYMELLLKIATYSVVAVEVISI